MKNTKLIEKKYNENVTVSITCDICKKTYKGENWEREKYQQLSTRVEIIVGEAYPGYAQSERQSFDVCPDCFRHKLIPLLKREYEAEPSLEDRDY